MMGVKVICKECEICPDFDVETNKDEMIDTAGNRIYETDLRCRHLERCVRTYQTMKKWEPDREKAQIEKEGGGSTWWDACTECQGVVDSQDSFCRHCGARFQKEGK